LTVDPIGNLSVRRIGSPLVYVRSDAFPVIVRGGSPLTVQTSSAWMLGCARFIVASNVPRHGLGAMGLRIAASLAGGGAQ